ncbi:hypothetical protein [Nibribacter koreensis]|uniref:DUF4345 domain-containing protein n=1 Tax=Nibribacter koreensis TaxID=1084519 RepID=A0ABP8FCI0_9BACT
MSHFFSKAVAGWGLLAILLLTILFHGLVLVGIIPYEIVWGGRLKSQEQMLTFETVSILINVCMVTMVAMYLGSIRRWVPMAFLKGMLWAMALLFLVNTVGNLFSVNSFEQMVFTPLTLLLCLFSLRLALAKEEAKPLV